MDNIETLKISFHTDIAYYIFNDDRPKTRVAIWARGELQPVFTQEDYDEMLHVDSNVDGVEDPLYGPDDLYVHILAYMEWTPVTELEMMVVTGLTPNKCKKILWGIIDEEDQTTQMYGEV